MSLRRTQLSNPVSPSSLSFTLMGGDSPTTLVAIIQEGETGFASCILLRDTQ
jgi:hypothetical protein